MGALVALTSLNLTTVLIANFGVVARTLPISSVAPTTPIVVTSPAHGVPLGRVLHGIVSGVTGTDEANGLWICNPLDADRFSLTMLSSQGVPVNSMGARAYTGGGQIQIAFPEGSILLGRRNLALATAVASPRIVMIPTTGRGWSQDPYGTPSAPAVIPNTRGTAEQQALTLTPMLATQYMTFETWVFGCAPNYGAAAPSPDYGDFDATLNILYAFWSVVFDQFGGQARVLREDWPSQMPDSGTMTQRGQIWRGIVEFQQNVTHVEKQFVPIGVQGQFVVEPVNPASGDPIVITIA
jgi:hypothetical protein